MPDCSPFWYTIDTMQALRGYDYHAFELFGPVHLFWLGLCAALCAGGFWLFRRIGPRTRRRILAVLTVLLLADELLKDLSSLATGQFIWQFLPFHPVYDPRPGPIRSVAHATGRQMSMQARRKYRDGRDLRALDAACWAQTLIPGHMRSVR